MCVGPVPVLALHSAAAHVINLLLTLCWPQPVANPAGGVQHTGDSGGQDGCEGWACQLDLRVNRQEPEQAAELHGEHPGMQAAHCMASVSAALGGLHDTTCINALLLAPRPI